MISEERRRTLATAVNELDLYELLRDLQAPFYTLRMTNAAMSVRGAQRRRDNAEATIRALLFAHLADDRDAIQHVRRVADARRAARRGGRETTS